MTNVCISNFKIKILLFIPMYNCEKQITRVLSQLTEEVQNLISEVIIVNNRSTDNGEEAVISFLESNKFNIPVSLLRNDENYGLGGSHKVAFNYAIDNGFDYVIVLHGDDQGNINDILPYTYEISEEKYDAILGARFIKKAKLVGYSKIRILGNYVFNTIFSFVVRKSIYDLGSGLNMYNVKTLSNKYYLKYPDTLYFNDLMILASCYYKHKIKFVPITWREEDQVSNNKLIKFSISLFNMLINYIINKEEYIHSDMRLNKSFSYSFKKIY